MIKKNAIVVMFVFSFIFGMVFIESAEVYAAVPTYNVNTFNVYSSSTKRALTSKNKGMKMLSKVPDGRCGLIYCYYPVRVKNGKEGWTMQTGHYYWYYIKKMGDKREIKFYLYPPKAFEGRLLGANPGIGLMSVGKLHMSRQGNRFLNIIKIDCLDGGYYFKYN